MAGYGTLRKSLPAWNRANTASPSGNAIRAFSGKVDTGFPSENATTQKEVERFPIQSNRKAL
jgi:hypothetical protein